MAQSRDTARPGWRKLMAEMPAMARLTAAQFSRPRRSGQQGHGLPVMVIPGFLSSDTASSLLRRTLEACGFRAYGWKQGFNRGATCENFERLLERVDALHRQHGHPLALVGWSLGGVYAREVAKRRPDQVSLVITLATPFSQSLALNNARKAYNAINDHPVERPPIARDPQARPPVRTIAMWSKRDGMVAPGAASGRDHEVDESIELHCRHYDFLHAPEAVDAVVAALSRWANPAPAIPSSAFGVSPAEPAPEPATPIPAPLREPVSVQHRL